MRSTVFLSRAGTGLLLAGLVATSGCSWFRKTNDLYAQAPEVRPLEVPPDLDQPSVTNAVTIPVPAASSGAQTGAVGFTTTGTRDDVYAKIGEALGAVDGVNIASRAEALGVYDVNYEGSNFLVRVVGGAEGVYVSAVDPRGMPASGDAPRKLIDSLRTAFTAE